MLGERTHGARQLEGGRRVDERKRGERKKSGKHDRSTMIDTSPPACSEQPSSVLRAAEHAGGRRARKEERMDEEKGMNWWKRDESSV